MTVQRIELYKIVMLFFIYIVTHLIWMNIAQKNPKDKRIVFVAKWWPGIYVIVLVIYLSIQL